MMDWEAIREKCIRTGEFIRVEKTPGMSLPAYFRETDMGLSKGELRQYRDDRATQSLHIHEFPDHFLAHVDLFNPNYHPVAHGILDTPGITLALVAGSVAAFFFAKAFRELDFLPPDDFVE